MQDYSQLEVATLAEEVAISTYQLTAGFPVEERYGLQAQMRRSAVSIGSNIAEGAGRTTDGDFRRFLGVAMGSANELHFQARLAARLGLCEDEASVRLQQDVERVKKATTGLIRYLTSQMGDRRLTSDV